MNDCSKCAKYHLVRHTKFGIPTYTEERCDAFGGWPDVMNCCYFKRKDERKPEL